MAALQYALWSPAGEVVHSTVVTRHNPHVVSAWLDEHIADMLDGTGLTVDDVEWCDDECRIRETGDLVASLMVRFAEPASGTAHFRAREAANFASVAIAARRKGVSVRAIDDEIVVGSSTGPRSFPTVDRAAAYLLACGAL
jgi:hypothetical protein